MFALSLAQQRPIPGASPARERMQSAKRVTRQICLNTAVSIAPRRCELNPSFAALRVLCREILVRRREVLTAHASTIQ
jgi:predicted metallo-beta-lactamase superfamily hydrolase